MEEYEIKVSFDQTPGNFVNKIESYIMVDQTNKKSEFMLDKI